MDSIYLNCIKSSPEIEKCIYPNNLRRLRKEEFSQAKDITYLDHAGATLYSNEQLDKYMVDLKNNLYGNPHSSNQTSDLASDVIHQVRCTILSHFNTSIEDYDVIFTGGATDAIKCIASTFNWTAGQSKFVYLEDNHTSVVGVREVAAHEKASSYCLSFKRHAISFRTPTTKNQSRFSLNSYEAIEVKQSPVSAGNSRFCSLFAYPSQSNFSGCKYPLTWIDEVKKDKLSNCFNSNEANEDWTVLLDAASFVSTSHLDLNLVYPDFVCLSFYKIFGFPTGLGALLVKKTAAKFLNTKVFFGGGTADGYISRQDFYKPKSSLPERLEDGTLPFLDILALKHSFDFLHKSIQRSMINVQNHTYSLAHKVYIEMANLCHYNGEPVIEVYSHSDYEDKTKQGPIVAFNVKRFDGSYVGFNHVLRLASSRDIHLRGGCFCNVGACMDMLGVEEKVLREAYQSGHSCGDDVDLIRGLPIGAVRASFGYMSTHDDATALLDFLRDCFISKESTEDLNNNALPSSYPQVELKAIFLYPVKSCRAMKVRKWPTCSTGLKFDRSWMVVNEHGVSLTLKREQRLSLIQPDLDLNQKTLTLKADGFGSITIPIVFDTETCSTTRSVCQTKVCSDRVSACDCGKEVAYWLSNVLGKSVSLVYKDPDQVRISRSQDPDNLSRKSAIGFANMAQYLLISENSVQYLKNAIDKSSEIDLDELICRFRCNLLISGAKSFSEEHFSEIVLTPKSVEKDTVRFQSTGLCNRCTMICVDSSTGERSVEPLRTLGTLPPSPANRSESGRRNRFGVYLSSNCDSAYLCAGSSIHFV